MLKYRKLFMILLAIVIAVMVSPVSYAAEDTSEQEQSGYSDTMFPENRNHDNERIIQSVNSGAVVNPASINNRMGTYDILTWAALIFTVVSVIVLWVLHTIRNRKDPLRKYKL